MSGSSKEREAKHDEFAAKQHERELKHEEVAQFEDTPEQAEARNLLNSVLRMTHVAQTEEDQAKHGDIAAFSLAVTIDALKIADEKKLRAGTGSSRGTHESPGAKAKT